LTTKPQLSQTAIINSSWNWKMSQYFEDVQRSVSIELTYYKEYRDESDNLLQPLN
jgi:hypothetical protein